MARPSKFIVQSPPTDTERLADGDAIAASNVYSTPGGITLTVSNGFIANTSQPYRVRVLPGSILSWTGGSAKLGISADGRVPQPIACPLHTYIPPVTSPLTLQATDRLIVMSRYPTADQFRFVHEAVLVECEAAFADLPALSGSWPTSITGFTSADVDDFLGDTSWWMETKAGWSGRYGHPAAQMPSDGEPGYGGALTVVTSFGAMLLCSNLSSTLKKQVQDRMLMMADDLELFGVDYNADGGHGNGRYILWLIRKALRPAAATRFTAASFSENQQIYRNGSNQIAWRFNTSGTVNPTYEFCCTINRWMGAAVAAKLATFLGANTSDWVTYTIAYMTAQENRTPAWQWSMSTRLAAIFAANKATIGY